MKTRVLIMLQIALAIILLAGLVFSLSESLWTSSIFFFFTFVVSFITFKNWTRSILTLLKQSDQLLRKNISRSPYSIANLDELKDNQEQLQRKLQVSAQLISELAHPEKASFHLLDKNDPIAKALVSIQCEMQRVKEEETRRTWVNESLAKFGEVLRKKADIAEYSQNIIAALVKALNVNQAGLFMEQKEDSGARYLELIACFAYNRKRFVERRVEVGQGLLGQCMLEREFILITDVPKDYVKITSGLGEATPRTIVVAPLVFNEIFCGAIELASFQILKPHEMEFLKKVCDDIAAEIMSLKNAEHTKRLLADSNKLTSELQLQDEQMRQNMEELAATQEEMVRKQREVEKKQSELKSYLTGVNNTLASAEFHLNGNFIAGNEIFMKVMGFFPQDLKDKSILDLMPDDASAVMMWENLKLGKFFSGEFKLKNKGEKELWLSGTFNPIYIQGDTPEKIVMLAQFTTQEKEKLNDLNTVVQALKSTLPVLEFNPDFSCKTANEIAMKIFGLSRLNLKSKCILDFIAPYFHGKWEKNKEEIVNNDFITLQLPFVCGASPFNFEVTVSAVHNLNGAVAKYVVLLVREIDRPVSILAAV